jgi:hypothetical protein
MIIIYSEIIKLKVIIIEIKILHHEHPFEIDEDEDNFHLLFKRGLDILGDKLDLFFHGSGVYK